MDFLQFRTLFHVINAKNTDFYVIFGIAFLVPYNKDIGIITRF